MLWPMQALSPFVTGPDVLSSIAGWGTTSKIPNSSTRPTTANLSERLFVLAAEKDVLCKPSILEDAAHRYSQAYCDMVNKGEMKSPDGLEAISRGQIGNGVRFRIAKGLAHHLQNHEEWEKGADEVKEWVEQL